MVNIYDFTVSDENSDPVMGQSQTTPPSKIPIFPVIAVRPMARTAVNKLNFSSQKYGDA